MLAWLYEEEKKLQIIKNISLTLYLFYDINIFYIKLIQYRYEIRRVSVCVCFTRISAETEVAMYVLDGSMAT
jgi:hypothetical protein